MRPVFAHWCLLFAQKNLISLPNLTMCTCLLIMLDCCQICLFPEKNMAGNVLVDIHLGISSAIQLREVVAPLWFIPGDLR